MKKNLLPLTLVLATMGFAFNASAQGATATALATATIVTPISIVKTVDMDFGNIAVNATTGGDVILTPGGLRTPSAGVTLPATAGTVTAATFTVGGEGVYTYTITLPATAITITLPATAITMANGASNMSINAFTSTPDASGALTAGAQTLNIGATLTVTAAQLAGTYVTATPFNVTVNYN